MPLAFGVVAPVRRAAGRPGGRPAADAWAAWRWWRWRWRSWARCARRRPGSWCCWRAIGVGMGLFTSPNNASIMGAAPGQQAGMASGVLNMTRGLGHGAGPGRHRDDLRGRGWRQRRRAARGTPSRSPHTCWRHRRGRGDRVGPAGQRAARRRHPVVRRVVAPSAAGPRRLSDVPGKPPLSSSGRRSTCTCSAARPRALMDGAQPSALLDQRVVAVAAPHALGRRRGCSCA